MRTVMQAQAQLPLDQDMQEELVLGKARQLYRASRVLSARYSSFSKLMADPLAGRCLRLAATQLVMRGRKQTRG